VTRGVGSTEPRKSAGGGFAGAGAGTIVLKVGGASAGGVADAVARLGDRVCVVHGAGPQISQEMARRGLEVRFVGGRRVTTRDALEVVRESFAQVSAAVCEAIGPRAVPLAGDEIGLLATPVPELGLVGDPIPSAPPAVLEALAAGLVPVVSPLARGPLNVNADEAASALALGIGAERIQFLTDVPGVYHEGELMESLSAATAESLVQTGAFDGGIVPKVLAAAIAARSGVAAEIGVTTVIA
jgi:acetylglutamate kinase